MNHSSLLHESPPVAPSGSRERVQVGVCVCVCARARMCVGGRREGTVPEPISASVCGEGVLGAWEPSAPWFSSWAAPWHGQRSSLTF